MSLRDNTAIWDKWTRLATTYKHCESVMPLAVLPYMSGLALNSCLKARTDMITTVIAQLLSFVSFRWVTQSWLSLTLVSPHCKSNTEAKRNHLTDRARWPKSRAQKNKNTMRENKLDPSWHALGLWQVQVKLTWEVISTAWAGAAVTVRVCGTKQGQNPRHFLFNSIPCSCSQKGEAGECVLRTCCG